MLTGIAFLIGAALLGIAIVRCLPPLRRQLNHAEQSLWGMVVGWIFSTLAAYLIALYFGNLTFRSMLILTLIMWLVSVCLWLSSFKKLRSADSIRKLWRSDYGWLLLVAVLFAPIYLKLFNSHLLKTGAEGVYTGGSTFFDIGFHLALTTSFLHGQNFPPQYTPFPPNPLLYPFLPDFQVSILATLGMSLRSALLLTAIPLAFVITGLLYCFAKRLFAAELSKRSDGWNSSVAAVLATILFLLNGGLGFIYFREDWRRSGKPLSQFWNELSVNYANMGGRRIQWTNFITDTLLPQRTSLFGFAVALIVFTVFAIAWHHWSLEEHKKNRWSGAGLLIFAGSLTGLLPWFHTHAYLGIGLVSGFLFLIRPRRQWLVFWLAAVLLGLPHLMQVITHVAGDSFMRFQPGWRGGGEQVWLWYWLRNIGLPALLIFPAWWAAPLPWRRFYLAFVLLLVFSLLVVVTPNNYDNIKLIYLWYLPTSVLIANWLVRLATIYRQRLLATVLTLICIVSGLLAQQFEALSHELLYSYEEMAAANFARECTPPHSLFLTSPTVHQTILSLAGRPIVRGDTAWLWSHGYEYADREADVKSIYAGSDEARSLIEYYGVDYVYLGMRETEAGANQAFFESNYSRVFQSSNLAIYKVSERQVSEPPQWPGPREVASRLEKDPHQFLVEFPRMSLAVYRFYQTAWGRAPRYDEFLNDLKMLGNGLYVGREDWEHVLEKNKQVLANNWEARDGFKSFYGGKSNSEYVRTLLTNANSDLDKERLVSALDYNSKSRGAVLRRVAESRASTSDYNTAFVLVHYFGYLRRNPDDPPDNNWNGFNFWLNDLNRTGDYRSLSRVFIESGEYKDRGRKDSGRKQQQ
jgi:hypothetical protein